MELEVIKYSEYEKELPQSGNHIVGFQKGHNIVVYQAYDHSIADFAIRNQYFGGDFRLNRMSWIKTGFLWMMYRSGWGTKQGQQRILAISISKVNFFHILKEAVHSSYNKEIYPGVDDWKNRLHHAQVRLQWDPDHDPHGKKLERKAVQLGLKGYFLEQYSREWISSIEDITPFVSRQREVLKSEFRNLEVIKEGVIKDDVE